MSDFYWFWIHCWNTEQEMMEQQPCLRSCMYRSLPRRGTLHHPAKSRFYSAAVYFSYIPGIHQVYTCHILWSASLPAFVWCRALTVCTPECEGLLLSCSVLVLNGRGGVAIKQAWKEWHPPKEVPHPANIQSRDRWGFIQLPNSVWLHSASGSS